jgi:hypothetical protein
MCQPSVNVGLSRSRGLISHIKEHINNGHKFSVFLEKNLWFLWKKIIRRINKFRMETGNLDPVSISNASKQRSILLTEPPHRENNQYVSSVRYTSRTNNVDLPPRCGSDEYDDLIAYETARKYSMQAASKCTAKRIHVPILIISLFILSIVIAVIGTWLFHTTQTSSKRTLSFSFFLGFSALLRLDIQCCLNSLLWRPLWLLWHQLISINRFCLKKQKWRQMMSVYEFWRNSTLFDTSHFDFFLFYSKILNILIELLLRFSVK